MTLARTRCCLLLLPQFLVPNPMRLAPDERQVLRIEFPGEGALD